MASSYDMSGHEFNPFTCIIEVLHRVRTRPRRVHSEYFRCHRVTSSSYHCLWYGGIANITFRWYRLISQSFGVFLASDVSKVTSLTANRAC